MTTPMGKLIASVSEFVAENVNTTISLTVLLAVIEQAKTLQLEEQMLFKQAFIMGSTCKPAHAVKSAEIFYKSNFENHERKNCQQVTAPVTTKL